MTAAVIVDPAGRLVWAWSRAGDLLAAGALRLRTHSYVRGGPAPIAPPDSPPSTDSSLLDLTPAAHRLIPDEPAETISAAECSSGDVGRLIMDWLSWSVQIGHAPDRVVCIGPATISHRPSPTGAGEAPPSPSSIAHSIGTAWPGATVDAAIHDDPIGATLNRIRALPMFAPSKVPSGDTALAEDPRLNMVSLTGRAGRFDRATHYWAALAILGAAAAVFLYARRVGSGIDELKTRLAGVDAERIELLESVEDLVPAVSKTPDPIGILSGKIQEFGEQLAKLSNSKPALGRLLPAIEILQSPEFSSIQITQIQASDYRLQVDFNVPETDDLIPPTVRSKLDEKYGAGVWEGTWGTTRGGRRPYSIYWSLPGGTNR